MDDNRKFSRVDFTIEALLKHGDVAIKGEVKNISLRGVFVETAETVPLGTALDVTIYLTEMPPYIAINVKGNVVRTGDGGIGVKFDKIDVDSFAHLRSIISHKYGDADKIMDEFFDSLDGRGQSD